MNKLSLDFYLNPDVIQIAKNLLGKVIFTNIDSCITGGIIIETEAYAGISDKASHAFGGRYTERTKTMYNSGGCSYVYLCYGIHHLFNVVTNIEGIPHAVLLRGIKPICGFDKMMERRKKNNISKAFSSGPGSAAEALGIKTIHNNLKLTENTIWIEDHGICLNDTDIMRAPRVGVSYAQEDALLEYNFKANLT